jgi:hypothetical protein
MRRFGLLGVYEWGLLAVLFGVVLHAPFSVMVASFWPEYELIAKAWKEIVLSLLVAIAAVVITRRRQWQFFAARPVVYLSIGFVVTHLILAVSLGGELNAVLAGLLIDLRFVAMFILSYVLITLRPQALKRMLVAVAAGAVIVIGFGLLQITILPDDALVPLGYSRQTITPFTTIDSNQDYVRINSTLRGPNPLGALMVIYIALLAAYGVKQFIGSSLRRRYEVIVVSLLAGAVLFASYSRSAYAAALAALAVLGAVTFNVTPKRVGFFSGIMLIGAASLAALSTTDWYSNVILHEDPESTITTKSNDEHIASLQKGTERLVRQPLGAGVGSTGSAPLYDADPTNDIVIENYYLYVAHEAGWIGLLIFMTLYGLLLWQLWLRRQQWLALGLFASGVGLSLVGLLLPVWADETVALIWWGLAAAAITHKRYNE